MADQIAAVQRQLAQLRSAQAASDELLRELLLRPEPQPPPPPEAPTAEQHASGLRAAAQAKGAEETRRYVT